MIGANLPYLKTNLVCIDRFQLLEYYPLVNPRSFSLKLNNKEILNQQFKATYLKFLKYLILKKEYSVEDRIVLVNYLIAQDRIQEAIEQNALIDSSSVKELNSKLQYDYQTAYLDFITGYPEFKKAKEISQQYLTYPILTWRNLFVEIINQLSEFEETELIKIDKEKDKISNLEKAKTESTYSCTLKDSKILINHENLTDLTIKFYKIDLEAYYSLYPFKQSQFNQFIYVAPF